jgi:hypothetical protein
MPKIALPDVSLWGLDAGLETVEGIGLRLSGVNTENFNDGSLSSLYTSGVSGGGSVVETSLLTLNGGASADAAFFYYNRLVKETGTEEYKRKFKVLSGNYTTNVILLWYDTSAPTAQALSGSKRRLSVEIGSSANLHIAYRDRAYTAYYWDMVSAWTTLLTSYTLSYNTVYTLILKTTPAGWKIILKNADESATLIETSWISWYSTWNEAGKSMWLLGGENYTDRWYCKMAVTQDVFPKDYASSSPAAESPWIAIDETGLDASPINIYENKIAALLGLSTGSIKYQYALNAGAYNGSWLTLAQLQAALADAEITNHTQSLRLKAQFISDGAQAADMDAASSVGASGIDTSATYNLPLEVIDISTEYEVVEI